VDLLLSDRTEVHPPPRWDSYLAFLRPMIGRYDAVLLDLPERLDQTLTEILGCCGRVLVVTTPDLVSVRLAERALREIISCGVDEERMEVVLNRWEKGDLNSQQLENHFRVPVTGLIPSDHRTLTASILKSEPLHSQTEIGQAFSRFASTFDSTLKMDTKSVTFGLKFKQMFGAASR
jgi:Flp pilus assembly CpaE family ATPase